MPSSMGSSNPNTRRDSAIICEHWVFGAFEIGCGLPNVWLNWVGALVNIARIVILFFAWSFESQGHLSAESSNCVGLGPIGPSLMPKAHIAVRMSNVSRVNCTLPVTVPFRFCVGSSVDGVCAYWSHCESLLCLKQIAKCRRHRATDWSQQCTEIHKEETKQTINEAI